MQICEMTNRRIIKERTFAIVTLLTLIKINVLTLKLRTLNVLLHKQ